LIPVLGFELSGMVTPMPPDGWLYWATTALAAASPESVATAVGVPAPPLAGADAELAAGAELEPVVDVDPDLLLEHAANAATSATLAAQTAITRFMWASSLEMTTGRSCRCLKLNRSAIKAQGPSADLL
jgi:hypothetical protein